MWTIDQNRYTDSHDVMFVANDIEKKKRVTSLDPEWGSRLDELRDLAASGRLVCPGCEQMLLFRVGGAAQTPFRASCVVGVSAG